MFRSGHEYCFSFKTSPLSDRVRSSEITAKIIEYIFLLFRNHQEMEIQNVNFSFMMQMSHIMRNLFIPYANNNGENQPAQPRSLISTFVASCLDSMLSLVSILAFLTLASFFSCADRFESYLVENPEDRFSRDEAQMMLTGEQTHLRVSIFLYAA